MQHLFVEYELAVELKEAGFDEPCAGFYHESELFPCIDYFPSNISKIGNSPVYKFASSFYMFEEYTRAPIYQQVFDWLEEKGIYLEYYFRFKDKDYGVFIVNGEEYTLWTSMDKAAPEWFKTKKQAWDRAIREALRILKEK